MSILYVTAGAAGMYCGSCMHDNTLAKSFLRHGRDCLLVPVYTPIRTDEEDVSDDHLFFGGINLYLQQKIPWLAYLPAWCDSWLNRPGIVRRATRGAMKTDPRFLGALTVSMLQGMRGNQRKEIRRLANWLRDEIRPNVVILSNALIGGCIPEIKREIKTDLWVTLQGDDIFLESLPEPYQSQAIQAIRKLVPAIDGFLLHSEAYLSKMANCFEIPRDKCHVVPLGIELKDLPLRTSPIQAGPFRIGYLARLAPEKGLDLLVDAFIHLKKDLGLDIELHIAGWLGPQHEDYWREQQSKLRDAQCDGHWKYWGAIDRAEKVTFLHGIDLLCVPARYADPKGLYALEAAAMGIPYLLPAHGAFPEMHERLQFGELFPIDDRSSLWEALRRRSMQGREENATSASEVQRLRSLVDIDRHAERVLDMLPRDNRPAP